MLVCPLCGPLLRLNQRQRERVNEWRNEIRMKNCPERDSRNEEREGLRAEELTVEVCSSFCN